MYTNKDVADIISRMHAIVSDERDHLNELDGQSGDGDLGQSMELAFAALEDSAAASVESGTDIGRQLMAAAMACNKAAPSTMGTLLSCGVIAIAKSCKGKTEISDEDVVGFPRVFADAISSRGGAKQGDKTILDALYPLADAVETAAAEGDTLVEAYTKGARAAVEAAEGTAGMQAKTGRAQWLGERAYQYPDGGATLCGILMTKLTERA